MESVLSHMKLMLLILSLCFRLPVSSLHLGALTANTSCGLRKQYIKITIYYSHNAKGSWWNRCCKNVKAQVWSQAHYTNRKIPVDFSGLHSLPKFGLEPNSQSHCQCTHAEFHSQPCSPRQEQSAQEMVQG